MSDQSLFAAIARVTAATGYLGAKIGISEVRELKKAALAPDPALPAGKTLTQAGADALKKLLDTATFTSYGLNELKPFVALRDTLVAANAGRIVRVPPKNGFDVYFSPRGLTVDAAGTLPQSTTELTSVAYEAASWLQASFGSADNLFSVEGVTPEIRTEVVGQIEKARAGNLSVLSSAQRDQLLGSLAALTVELVKALPPADPLRPRALATLDALLKDDRLSVLVRRGMVGYLSASSSFQRALEPAQKAALTELHGSYFPQAPADYAKWEAEKKSVIRIEHACGDGENFLYGFSRELMEQGVGGPNGQRPKNLYKLVSGDIKRGPAVLRATLAKEDPLNTWGREMTVEIRVRQMFSDIYAPMDDEGVDIVSYGGHSNFGNNTLNSLRNAPAQKGDKLIARDLCCGADTKNAEAHQYPEASLNSVTSISSSYFRIRKDPEMGDYAYESEGNSMLQTIVRGLLQKQDWSVVGRNLERHANWWGHDSRNNWTWPTDPRAGTYVDEDDDGVPNVFDVLPWYDTTSPSTSVTRDFDLSVPKSPVNALNGRRAFQAIQFVNTASVYNPVLQPLNIQRRLIADPQGMWFDGKNAPNEYARFRVSEDGKYCIQLNSALFNLSLETLRTVLYVEFVRFLGEQNPRLFASVAERNAMAILFATSSLEYDGSYRDSEIFNGMKRLYGLPADLRFEDVKAQVLALEGRHNYTGDREAVKALLGKYLTQLSEARVLQPAVATA